MFDDSDYEESLVKSPLSGPGQPGPKLEPAVRNDWNNFVSFLEKKGLRGSPLLDDKNTALGQKLMDEYRQNNPNSKLTYDMVPQVQQDLQDYRTEALKKIHAGGAVVDGVASDKDFMPNLSPVDGWLGSKTSDHLYPTAVLTNQNTGNKKDFGTNVELYNQLVKQK